MQKVNKERSSWIYSHSNFQREKPELLDTLRRKTNRSDSFSENKAVLSAESSIKRSRDSTDVETSKSLSESSDESSLSNNNEDNSCPRKRSVTVTDDIIHNWDNVINFFQSRVDYLVPIQNISPTHKEMLHINNSNAQHLNSLL